MLFETIIITVLIAIFSEDLKTCVVRLCDRLVVRAAGKLHHSHFERYGEEWLALLRDTPQISGKLYYCLSIYFVGVHRLASEIGYGPQYSGNSQLAIRIADVVLVMLSLPFCLPFLGLVTIASGVRKTEYVGHGGNTFFALEFCSSHEAVSRLLDRTGISHLPNIFAVLRGNMSLVGPKPILAKDTNDAHSPYILQKPGMSWMNDLDIEQDKFGIYTYFIELFRVVTYVVTGDDDE